MAGTVCYPTVMSSIETQSPATAYCTKDNIVLPPEQFPTAAHITALQSAAVSRLNDGVSRPTTTAVKTLKKG